MSLDRERKLVWLGRYRRALMRVIDIENELSSLAGLRITRLTGLPGAHLNTSLDNTIIRQEQLTEEYKQACEELQIIKHEVVSAIDNIADANASRAVYLRHINLLNWPDIAETMNYAESSVRRYHRAGIDALEPLWTEMINIDQA